MLPLLLVIYGKCRLLKYVEKDNVTLAHIQLNNVMCESIKQCAVLCMKLTILIFTQLLLSLRSSHECNAFMDTAQRQQHLQHMLLYHINHANQQQNALNVLCSILNGHKLV